MVAVVSDAGRAKRLFAEAYDRSADGFARSADRLVYGYLARPLARALAEAAGRVLDVAAGSGALGRLLPAVVALDLSAAQLRHNPLEARLQGDAERLPFRDGTFAAAGCAFGINHFPDPGGGGRDGPGRPAGRAAHLGPARAPLPSQAGGHGGGGPPRRQRPHRRRRPRRRARRAGRLRRRRPGPAGGRRPAPGRGRGRGRPPLAGAAAFVDYRLATVGVAGLVDDPATVRREAIAAVAALPAETLPWTPRLVLGVGRR